MKLFYFSKNEFRCRCGCGADEVHPLLVAALNTVRMQLGRPIYITSGVRCSAHNEAVGGVPDSAHLPFCKGLDIVCHEHMDELYQLCDEIFPGVGDGRSRGFIHIDIKTLEKRRWSYDETL